MSAIQQAKGVLQSVVIGDAILYLGDALNILPSLSRIDSVVTDPPYGVELGSIKNGQSRRRKQLGYGVFQDSPEYVRSVCVPVVQLCIAIAKRCVVTPGNRCMWSYPQPDDMGAWWNPAGTSIGRWGFNCVQTPILYYGKDPRSNRVTPSSPTGLHSREEKPAHPCPKPLPFVEWLVNKGSLCGESVLDPFMGSGTTGVACANLGRKFVGIEIDPDYFHVAVERIKAAQSQQRLFA